MSEHAVEVVDDTEHQRFLYRERGQEAQLVYDLDGDRLVLVHTEVPEALGGRGIGGQLVRAAARRAAATEATLTPWCPFARRWLHDHPDVTAHLRVDWTPPA